MKCEHGITPWWDCDRCRPTAKYGVQFRGTGWTPRHYGDIGCLPPADEVDQARAEAGRDRLGVFGDR